jgi:hypothetical protein
MPIRRSTLLLAIGIMSFGSAVFAAADGSQLELPKAAKVAIVVFESLEAPDCARYLGVSRGGTGTAFRLLVAVAGPRIPQLRLPIPDENQCE